MAAATSLARLRDGNGCFAARPRGNMRAAQLDQARER
jgi:hypothetical protein